jgi:hypothetical protein
LTKWKKQFCFSVHKFYPLENCGSGRAATAKPKSTTRAADVDQPAGGATLTAKAGTGKPQASNTGEPAEPPRTQTRQPKPETARANADAERPDANGTNKHGGAGDHPAPAGNARRAQTQPPGNARHTTPAPRREPTEETETKPAIHTPRSENHNPKKKKKEKKKKRF